MMQMYLQNEISRKIFLQINFKLAFWRSMTRKAGSASGFICQRHGSLDPDPHQNVMDPEHCFQPFFNFTKEKILQYWTIKTWYSPWNFRKSCGPVFKTNSFAFINVLLLCIVVDPHWFWCGSGSSFLSECGSGAREPL